MTPVPGTPTDDEDDDGFGPSAGEYPSFEERHADRPEDTVWVVACGHQCGFVRYITADECEETKELAYGVASLHNATGCRWPRPQYVGPETPDDRHDGLRLCGYHDDEDSVQAWLAESLRDAGWRAEREVEPRESNHAADVVAEHDDLGLIGFEVKFFDSDGGGKAADAHHQITRKYRGRRYPLFGNRRVNAWAFVPYYVTGSRFETAMSQQTAIREFMWRHGIGDVDLTRPYGIADFVNSKPEGKVPLFAEDKHGYETETLDEYRESFDREYLDDFLARKMEDYDYHTAADLPPDPPALQQPDAGDADTEEER